MTQRSMTHLFVFRNDVDTLVLVEEMQGVVDRVRELIASSGSSQGDFARAVGLDDPKLSKSLGGTRRFSSLDLAKIADANDVTVDWLLTGEQKALALAARSTGGSAREAVLVAEELADLRESATRLGYPQPWSPPESPALGGLRWVDQGEAIAEAALRHVRSQGGDPLVGDLPALVETAFGADVAVRDLGAGFDGLAVSSGEVKLILLSVSMVPARQRFTLAHELGHLLAGDDQEVHLDPDVHDRSKRKDPSEMRANAFAAAFLMPEESLAEAVGTGPLDAVAFAGLVHTYGVSPSALAWRLFGLRLIDAGTREEHQVMSTARAADLGGWGAGFAMAMASSSTPRVPGLLSRDLYAAYASGATTLRPYARLMGVSTRDLRRSLEAGSILAS